MEKKFLMARLLKQDAPRPLDLDLTPVPHQTTISTPKRRVEDEFLVKDLSRESPKETKKSKKISASLGAPSKKTKSATPLSQTKHTEHKRQKMRERERQKRQRLVEKKQRKMAKRGVVTSQRTSVTTSPLPLESIRELGNKLMTKFTARKETTAEKSQ
jgi:hypothetical protein